MVRLQTLGKLDLHAGNGETLAAVTSRPREMALLIYLAAAGQGAYRRRDTILAMFWPETPEDRARHTLNQMLYGLRRALGDGVLISHGQDEIGVSGDLLQCDVAEFRRALEETRWEDALALYHGPFLPGFFVSRAPDMERWIDEERQDHRRAARNAAVALSEQLEREGDLRAAAGWAQRAWEIEPSSDSLLRRPLSLLHRLGERSEALVLFEDFRQRIAQDYGLEPSAETLELVALIRAGDTARGEDGGALQATVTTTGVSNAPTGGNLPTYPPPQKGRGLGGTLVGAGAALVGVAAVSWVILSSGSATAPPLLESAAPVVVVIPVVVSGSVSPEYGDLARALTGELTTFLGENPGLVVVPTESMEPHLQGTVDALEVGRRLQGNAVIESSLDWQASGVETSARVTDVLTGEVVWGTSHRYPHTEILSAQMDLTVGIASALNVRLGPLPQRDLTFSSDEEVEAWSLVAEAHEALRPRGAPSPEVEDHARALIQSAMDLDSEYAPAYAALQRLYHRKWTNRRSETSWLDSMLVAAERAVALDPDHFVTQMSLAQAMYAAQAANPGQFPPALLRRGEEAALRAVQLNPGSWEATWIMSGYTRKGLGRTLAWVLRRDFLRRDFFTLQRNRAHLFWQLGDYDRAVEAAQLVGEMDSRDPRPEAFRISEYNLSRGRLEEARQQIEVVRQRDPQSRPAIAVAIYLELMDGRYAAAEELIEELLNRDPPVEYVATSNFYTRTALGYVYLKTGRGREGKRLLELVRDLRLDQVRDGNTPHYYYDLARVYAMLEDPDQAVHWLGIALDRGWPYYYTEMGRTDPMLENLVGNEEFERLMDGLKEFLDAERAWVLEILALPEPERLRQMLLDAEDRLEARWEAQGGAEETRPPPSPSLLQRLKERKLVQWAEQTLELEMRLGSESKTEPKRG